MKSRDVLLALVLVGGLAGSLAWLKAGGEDLTGTARIVDGDTLAFRDRKIRLDGLDAPEMGQSCRRADGSDYRCGIVARDELVRLTAGRAVQCRADGRDRYGRSLAQCEAQGRDLGATLVRRGLAVGYGRYAFEEAAARVEGAGLWAGAFERPAEWRRTHPRVETKGRS